MATPHVPLATYRLQFNRHFGFRDAARLVPYLHSLGVSDLYASPLLAARPGSLHGYDVTNPTRLNGELGTPEDFDALCRELQSRGMGLLLDIVPNHMSTAGENEWWMDVLENGPRSPFASYFDIDWQYPKPALRDKVLLPILGGPYGSVIENQDLALRLEEDGFFVRYGDVRLPVALKSYVRILRLRLGTLQKACGANDLSFRRLQELVDEIERLCTAPPILAATSALPAEGSLPVSLLRHAPGDTLMLSSPPDAALEFVRGSESPSRDFGVAHDGVKRKLWSLYQTQAAVRDFIDQNLRILNGRKGDPASFEPLDQLLDEQAYWLSFWRLADEEINYRRFFTISDLICLRVEDPSVFRATHAYILELVRSGNVQGLRVDHVDGLHDPLGYLETLRTQASDRGRSPYLVVEKILAVDETLPGDWPALGTTGYDCLNTINGVFVDSRGAEVLSEGYATFTSSKAAFKDVTYGGKHLVMKSLFGGEMRSLGYQLALLAEQDRHVRDLPRRELERALVEVTACLPVYRTYTRTPHVTSSDRRCLKRALAEARMRNLSVSTQVFDFLESVLLLESPSYLAEEQRRARLRFVMRWQQFTGPIMAKGVEDTALYVYNRLVSLNEVGGDPGAFGLSIEAFHDRMAARQSRWPYTMNTTSTHDTKRGEDVRARINVLSEIPQEWKRKLDLWSRWNRPHLRVIEGVSVPDRSEEYLLYQTLVGAWPFRSKEEPDFRRRLEAYAVKAAREAKVHTRWTRPEVKREKALAKFIGSILEPSTRFMSDFLPFQKRIAFYGALNGLGQVLLKALAPGIPDFYQGSELWDLSLVDPDNRRPVDFRNRIASRQKIESRPHQECLGEMLEHWEDGRIKLFLVLKSLSLRQSNRELFLEGNYLPLQASGNESRHICGFARHKGAGWVVVVVPRFLTALVDSGEFPLREKVWGRSMLRLPKEAPGEWLNVLTGETLDARRSSGARSLPLAEVFKTFPLTLLAGGRAQDPFA
jgi:(1->4)-alpha-D-glucan 1-alpha-D-glucosylmutase